MRGWWPHAHPTAYDNEFYKRVLQLEMERQQEAEKNAHNKTLNKYLVNINTRTMSLLHGGGGGEES